MTTVPAATGAARLVVLSRADCGLCAEMLDELAQLSRQQALPRITVQDVDTDAELARRHALDLPVLLLDGVVVCKHRLDAADLLRLLRQR